MKSTTKIAAATAALLLICANASASPNLVTNGSFEDGPAGWTMNMGLGNYGPTIAHSGDFAAATGCVGPGCTSSLGSGSFFGQSVATTAGELYDLSFWVGENTGPTSGLSVFWNGAKIADILNPANRALGANMVQFTFAGLAATGSATAFEIHGRQDPGAIYFDDVSVTAAAVAAVPEPGTLATVLAGLGLLGARLRRNRRPAR
jgi:hypothetical protein